MRLSAVVLGLIAGVTFAAIEFGPVLFARWRAAGRGSRVLLVSVTCRFFTGLLIPTADLGMPLWASGLALGLGLSVPIVVVSRRLTAPLGMGAVGGIVIAAIAELAT